MRPEILRLSRVTQTEGKNFVLRDINLHIFRGEIMGLVCRNPYGLDALLRLIQTNEPIYYGHVWFNETLTNSYRHSSMHPNKVAVIEARSKLLENLSLADNIFVMRPGFRMRLIPEKQLERQVSMLLSEVGMSIPVDADISQMSVYHRCVVELLRAKVAGAGLIVLLDLSNLIRSEYLERFHALVRRFANEGLSFLYVCNRQIEAQAISDRIAIMENGRIRRVLEYTQWNQAQAEQQDPVESRAVTPEIDGEIPVLELRGITTEHLPSLTLTVHAGEYVLLRNMSRRANANLQALLEGRADPIRGSILLDGNTLNSFDKSLPARIPIITENPIESMLFKNLSYLDNLCFLQEKQLPPWRSANHKNIIWEYKELLGDTLFADDISALTPYELYNLIYYRIALVKPRAVLIIKPFAEADKDLRAHVASLIRMLQANGIGLLITTLSSSRDDL
ncbi:sugar ABC transporter ATP-binding protein [Clostridia bacterium]|nr:sugar ABC transporter ATP-binding protein [Clostridia bacterium]